MARSPFPAGDEHAGSMQDAPPQLGREHLQTLRAMRQEYERALRRLGFHRGQWAVRRLRQADDLIADLARRLTSTSSGSGTIGDCPTCAGCGQVSTDSDRSPWIFWAELARRNRSVALAVRPLPCSDCGGSGQARRPAPDATPTPGQPEEVADAG